MVVGFGEVLLRLNPKGYLRFIQADNFEISYAGAEANVCVSLSNFGVETEIVAKLPDNDISRVAVAGLKKFGVGVKNIVYGGDRMGVLYVERGASQRPSKVVYDRKYTSISQSEREDYDWERILEGAEWFHITGITPALGKNLPQICKDACETAQSMKIPVSCDLNYRANLWSSEQAQRTMTELVRCVDVLIGNEEDAYTSLGIKPSETDVTTGKINSEGYIEVAKKISETYGPRTVAFTLRTSLSASDNRWAAMLYEDGKAYFSKTYDIHMVDRVGGGDSFAAALIYSQLKKYGPKKGIEFAVAASCLKQTIELDFNLSTVDEVTRLMNGDGSGRVQR